MKKNHLLATSTFLEPKTQDQKLKYLIWGGEGHGGYKN